jgi:hypothetical protein
MSSIEWSNRIQSVHEFRKSWNPDRFARVKTQHAHINYNHNTIFNIPSILYASLDHSTTTTLIEQLYDQQPYLVAFPDSSINRLVIMTIDGRNKEGDNVVNDTLCAVYGLLHISVKQEIADAQELLRLNWDQRIQNSWEKLKIDYWHTKDYGYQQYWEGPTVQSMIEQFDRESWEIHRGSDVLWEEKEMIWLSSLGEHQRALLGLPAQIVTESSDPSPPSESDEPWSPTTDELNGVGQGDDYPGVPDENITRDNSIIPEDMVAYYLAGTKLRSSSYLAQPDDKVTGQASTSNS